MKKFIITMLLIMLVFSFVGCTRDKDRAENNGIVTDEVQNGTTDGGLVEDVENGVSDVVKDATDMVDDMLGSEGFDKDTTDRNDKDSGKKD